MAHEKLLCSPEEKAAREIANQATVAEYLSEFVKSGRTRITENVLLEIHQLTIAGIYPCAGTYRDALTKIEITGTDHKPSHASQVRMDVWDMLDWLYGAGQNRSPVERAAYIPRYGFRSCPHFCWPAVARKTESSQGRVRSSVEGC